MAKLSKREAAAKKAGVPVDYSKSAKQQGTSAKYKANAKDVYSSKNLKTAMSGGVPAPNLNDPFGYAAQLKSQYGLSKLEKSSEKAMKNINKFNEQTTKQIHNIEKQPLALPVMGRQEAVYSGQRSEESTALGNELAQINQRLGYAQQGYTNDLNFYTGQQSLAVSKANTASDNARADQTQAMNQIKLFTDQGIEMSQIPPEILKKAGMSAEMIGASTTGGQAPLTPKAQAIQNTLMATAGTDKFVNPDAYMQQRDDYVKQSGATDNAGLMQAQQNFDATFGNMVNPSDRMRLGLPEATPEQGKDYKQVGLLAQTSYDPQNNMDLMAKNYIERYLKNNKYPTAYELGLGRGTSPAMQNKFQNIQNRADELYYEATGSSLPSVSDLTGTWKIINQNKGILNKINIASDTVESNFNLSIAGEISSNVNKNATLVNQLLNPIYLALGDPAVNQAMVSNGTITQEFANLISTRNAQGTLEADKRMAEELLPFGTSVEAQKAVVTRLVQEATNIKSALNQQNNELWKQVDPLQQNANNPNREGGGKKSGIITIAPDGTTIEITD